jgi:hypothetical protein
MIDVRVGAGISSVPERGGPSPHFSPSRGPVIDVTVKRPNGRVIHPAQARAGVVATAWRRWLAVALAGVTLLAMHAAAPAPTAAVAGHPGLLTSVTGAGCSGLLPVDEANGSLSVDGGPPGAASVASMPIRISFSAEVEVTDVSNGAVLSTGCVDVTANATTTASGSFSAVLVLPSTSCLSENGIAVCTTYSGPYGPVAAAPAVGPPIGYALSAAAPLVGDRTPVWLGLAWVWELASIDLSPSARTVAPGEVVNVWASARMQNGSPSPLDAAFTWTLLGPGWSFVGPTDGAAVDLEAAPEASLGTLTVTASAAVDGSVLQTPPYTIALAEMPTTIVSAGLAATAVDAGAPVAVSVTASGPAGYAYGGTLTPGLGLPAVPLTCTGAPAPSSAVLLNCTTSVVYPRAGVAQPSVTVSNGFSGATWSFPNVTIASPPSLVWTGRLTGYPATPVPVSFSVATGTGVGPFAQACFDGGVGPVECLPGPGPTWSFAPTYAAPGSYEVRAWAIDATGANVSVDGNMTIVANLSLGPIVPATTNWTVGVAAGVSATLFGGLAPLHYWWNVSGLGGAWASGGVLADGNLSARIVPPSSGVVDLTLTAADALGTVVRTSASFAVAPAPAATVTPWVAPPAAPVVVGSSATLAWAALDREGNPAYSFGVPASLSIVTDGGVPRAWVNATGAGPLSSDGAGLWALPATAWVDGVVTVSVVPATAGTYTVTLGGPAVPNVVTAQSFTAVADTAHVQLFGPSVAFAAGRTGSSLWHVADRFGNPVPGAVLSVRTAFGTGSSAVPVVVERLADGTSGVWLNYSVPGTDAATIEVFDASGAPVLGPLEVAAVAPTPASGVPVVFLVFAVAPLAAVAVGVSTVVRRRRRSVRPASGAEEELRRFAEGRERVVALLGADGPSALAALERRWGEEPPPELADWIASLVADGTLRASVGRDRVARFCLAHPPRPEVVLDAAVLDAALRRRDEENGTGTRT